MVNKVTLIGNLGRAPELFHTQSGQPVARLSIATNKVWTKNGERQRRTEWHRVMVWGLPAERLTAQLHKSRLVYVEGRVCTRTFTNADNTQQTRTEIYAHRLMSLRSAIMHNAAYSAAEADGFRN